MRTERSGGAGLERRVRRLLGEGDLDGAATAAIEALVPGVLRYLRTMLPEDDAHDVLSAVEEDVWRGLPGFRWECSLRAWAYRIAWRAVARHVRNGYRRRRQRLPSSIASRLPAPEPSMSGLGGRRDRLSQLREELPPEERSLLVLRVGRNLEWEEVSAVLAEQGREVSVVALRKRFERLKQRLGVLARERGLLG
jgi:RNA polymerase sigma-70 factor (ECF subfamily)